MIDGGVRDVAYLRKIGFPSMPRGIIPATSAGHYRVAGTGVPVVCDGVKVNAGDIVAADSDGVVVVPREIAPKVLVLSQQLDFKEHSMYAFIENTNRSKKQSRSLAGCNPSCITEIRALQPYILKVRQGDLALPIS